MLHAKGRLMLDRAFDVWVREAAAVGVVEIVPLDVGKSEPEEAFRANVGLVADVLLQVLRCHVARIEPVESSPLAQPPPYCRSGNMSWACGSDSGGSKINTVLIEGHSDSVPIGKPPYKDNLDLSAARSAEVFRMMRQCEPELAGLVNRSGSPVLNVSGYGETRPVVAVSGDAGPNRRIDLRFVMELPEGEADGRLPPVEETEHGLAVEGRRP